MQRLEEAGEIAPDQSILLHEFADGWQIRQLQTVGDYRREGRLMRSCCAKYIGDQVIPGSTWQYQAGEKADDEIAPEVTAGQAPIVEMPGDITGWHAGMRLTSLRDSDGLPHLTFWAEPGWGVTDWGGYRNCKNPKAEYIARLREWIELSGSFEVTVRTMRALRMRAVPAGRDERAEFEQLEAVFCCPADRHIARDLIMEVFVMIGGRQNAVVHSFDMIGPDENLPCDLSGYESVEADWTLQLDEGLAEVRAGWMKVKQSCQVVIDSYMQQLRELAAHVEAGGAAEDFPFDQWAGARPKLQVVAA
jgi:hypothetical protein